MTPALHHGLLLLNKKPGFTSFDSLAAVKRAFSTGKAGHTGTLDKFASGLLVVLIGRGLKLIPLFSSCIKEYTGTIRFGSETDTLDPEGAIVAQGPIPSEEAIENALAAFRGEILQEPPHFSALHIGGKRAHELAREGKAFKMTSRPITVYTLELISYTPPDAVIYARVSPGTYIRSLARDIALACGSRAHLAALERTAVGPFRLEESVEDRGEERTLINALRPLDRKLLESLSLPFLLADDEEAQGFIHGKPPSLLFKNLESRLEGSQRAGVFRKNFNDSLLGILENKNGTWGYMHVFADS